jgi:Na+/melibiose symporter-like transporter
MAGSMMADVADEHELSSGHRQEGIFFGALAFAGKSTSGLGSLIGGLGLDWIGFPVGAEPGAVDPATVTALGVFYGPGIAIIAVVALVFLSRYRIDRARHAKIAEALVRQRSAPAE